MSARPREPVTERLAPSGGEHALARELGDFLVLFSISLHKHAIYPPGHPLLEGAAHELQHKVMTLLRDRGSIAIGAARTQLVIDGIATDPSNPLLRDLAARLHRHHVGALHLLADADAESVRRLLATLAEDPDRSDDPVGLRAAPDQGMRGIRLLPVDLASLGLAGGATDPEASRGAADTLWLGLARAAMRADIPPDDARLGDAGEVARAIEAQARDVGYDQVIVGYLLQIAEELRSGRAHDAAALRERVSQLIASLSPDTLSRLLDMGGDANQRRHFLLDASHGVAVDAVLDLLQAAAAASGQTISHAMLRLLNKLATHAAGGASDAGRADGELRDQVRRLVRGWSLDDPNPDEYRLILDRMAQSAPDAVAGAGLSLSESERIIAMSLELGIIEEPALRAAADMLARGQGAALGVLLADAPQDAASADALWRGLATPERLATELAREPLDLASVQQMVAMAGTAAAGPLLDTLASSPSRGTRRQVLELLVSLGPDAGPPAVERIAGAPWYLARNLLILLRRLPVLPEGWTPAEFAQSPDARVRLEAVRLMLQHDALRERGIVAGVRDTDAAITRLALGAAAAACPRAAVLPIVRRVRDGDLDAESRPLALRALAISRSREGLEELLAHTVDRTIFRRLRLATRSPELLVALAGLAEFWSTEPRAAAVLALAARAGDRDVRAAAGAPG